MKKTFILRKYSIFLDHLFNCLLAMQGNKCEPVCDKFIYQNGRVFLDPNPVDSYYWDFRKPDTPQGIGNA